MSTQGIVTITSGDKVLMKIVAGCNGFNAKSLKERISQMWPVSAEQAYQIANEEGFGCKRCLIVISEEKIIHDDSIDQGEISKLYRKTFNKPKFNPRWARGTADHVAILSI